MDNGIGIAKGVGFTAVVMLGTDDKVSGWWGVVCEELVVGERGEVVSVNKIAMRPEFDLEAYRILGQPTVIDVLPSAEQGVGSSDSVPELTSWWDNTDMCLQGSQETDAVGIRHLTGSGRSFRAVEGECAGSGNIDAFDLIGA